MAALNTKTLTAALRSETLASVYQEVAKAHATRKLARRVKWRGCDISIEQDKGDVRRGVDADGHAWETKMAHPYGYLKGTTAMDGDHLDAFLLEHDDWENCPVHVIHQVKAGAPTIWDEDKLVLGARDEREAKAAYLANYDAKGAELFGAMSVIPPEQLEAYVKGGRENWGRPLVHGVRQKIMLRQRQVEKAQALLEERREWLRGRVEVLKAGGPFDELPDIPGLPRERTDPLYFTDEEGRVVGVDPCGSGKTREELLSVRQEEIAKALEPVRLANEAIANSSVEVYWEVEKAINGLETRRLIRVTPSFEAIDLQNQLTTKDVIREAWPYYEQAGNYDLEHLTKKGGKSFEEFKALVKAQGFQIPDGMDEVAGRDYYEIGRPVKGSFDPESCTYLVEIYKGHPPADWFWHTLTEVSPPWPWKNSIGGAAKLTEVVAVNPEPIFGKGREQKFEVLRQFRWNNTAATLEPVNNYCPPVEVVRGEAHAISKGVDIEFAEETPVSCEMTKATDVLKAAMMDSAQAVISDMLDSGQITQNEALAFTAEVAKALEPLEGEAEVVKALEYGTVTTDVAAMEGGQAFTREGLSRRQVRRKAKELLEDTEEGLTPFQKGFAWSEDPVVDVAEYVQDDLGLSADDALAVANEFFGLLTTRSA
ncbi:hypothetical protein [Deinococcus sp. S9]|uniref:hypothetical protein n=1 Tax=Deinococcus sp. S9 TaxID=2545754 RepID=UPI001055D51B|nr:hypothetical protein [Deinococcus sp. S9]TDE87338.1 hypothetical protein E0686_02260 [Deinococcus sp. S9]